MMRQRLLTLGLTALIVALAAVGLLHGSVSIPAEAVWGALTGSGDNEAWRYIIVHGRLPGVITALLSGAALAVSGLLLQTAFRNPLAAPDILGVTGGSALCVALLTLAPGLAQAYGIGVFRLSTVVAAFMGAMVVTAVLWTCNRLLSSHVALIIIGIMVSYLTSSAITLLNAFATKEGLRSFVVWGMGDFGGVATEELLPYAAVITAGIVAAFLLVKPLNALLMGTLYAESMGINVRRTLGMLLVITGLLTAVVTAFCGPVAFISLAVPHVARILCHTAEHRRLMPVTVLTGAALALLCHILTSLPSDGTLLPLNAITPIFGAPVIIYVVIAGRR